ncbi:prolyl aminopeptidase [Cellulomonas sp. RIT-PI-Y]|uniref:prolyl aminopeptidase n=1 Tax=Cellulomonas sp. RIT-PI-Y TaxID=3035297 RepID=UPI0021D89A3D|nr:prolyl aminopeptidase [Cellulomonas sp. RIT-PI-Y]
MGDDAGLLTVDDGAQLYWETGGDPGGTPALWLHGGPGSGLNGVGYRRHFDPERYRVIGVDQRGCGRSRPLIVDDLARIDRHTTQRMIADLEAVREHLGVDRWVVAGGSWGSTLALAYALAHPDRVRALALVAVTTTGRAEVDWITEGVGRIFPEEWERFAADSGRRPGERVVEAYARRLTDPAADRADRRRAADAWDRWETTHISLLGPVEGIAEDDRRLLFATTVAHYWAHDAFLTGGAAILDRVHELASVPAALVHGRRDVSGPVITPWLLHRDWPASTLQVVDDEGHGGDRELALLRAALDGFAAAGTGS